jgi:RNA polymerase sigma-70 factor (ECF subfamily)
VATNACLDELRRRKRRPAAGLPDDMSLGEGSATSTVAIDLLPDRLAIDDALAELPEEFRTPVVLRDLCDLDYAEIAETLGIPPGTVRSRIARGRAQLARRLGSPSTVAGNQTGPSGRPTTADDPPTTR